MNATNFLENGWIDHLFRTASFPKPTALWVALFTGAPGDAGGGVEVTGGGYARVNHPPLNTNWTATQGGTAGPSTGTAGTTSNAAAVTYPAPTADWRTVTHCALFDAPTGGNPIVWGPLTSPRDILAGDPPPRFPAGAFQVTAS